MPVTRDRVTRLREFGLSEYAARAYLALLDLGTTEARDVSSLSKVPASKIYHILDQLHEKGLVDILPEFPRKYAPVPFSEFLDKIQEEHAEGARKLQRERSGLLEMFALVGGVSGSDRGSLTFLRGRRNAFERYDEVVRGAKEDVLVLATPGMLLARKGWTAPLFEAASRGVAVRALIPSGSESAPGTTDLRGVAALRLREPSARVESAGILVIDESRVLMTHFLPDDGHVSEGNASAVYVDQDGVVALLAGLAEGPWRHGEPLGSAIRIEGEAEGGVKVPLRD